MNTTGNPITELAEGLRTTLASAALRTPLLATLISLILARLDRVLHQLEALLASWQAGTLPAPRQAAAKSAYPAPAPPANAPSRAASARMPTRMPGAPRRHPPIPAASEPAPEPAPEDAPEPGVKPAKARPKPARSPATPPPCIPESRLPAIPTARIFEKTRPCARARPRPYYCDIETI